MHKHSTLSILIALSALALWGCDDNKTVESADAICGGIDCSGHGACVVRATDKQPVCVCDINYHLNAGELTACVADIAGTDACKDVTCGGHGVCAVKDDGSAICICDADYHLNIGELTSCVADGTSENPCKDVSCSEHGVCAVKGGNSAVCICNSGYHRDDANATLCVEDSANVSKCENVTCSGDENVLGTCAVKDDGDPICLCNQGYHLNENNLVLCVADDPLDNPCENVDCRDLDGTVAGSCVVTADNRAVCVCNSGYHADSDKCYKDADPCEGYELCGGTDSALGTCNVNDGVTAICSCIEGYHISTDNLTTCIKDDVVINPCDDASVDCGDDGFCAVKTSDSTAICICGAGKYTEPENPTKCLDAVCKNVSCDGHGTCMNYGGQPLCVCDEWYGGDKPDHCYQIDPVGHEDYCDESLGHHNDCETVGTCINTMDKYACVCGDGYFADIFDSGHCHELHHEDPCKNIDCGGHGACVNYGEMPLCVCEQGYKRGEPTECKKIDFDDPCFGVTCGGHGSCSEDGDGNAQCACDDGYYNDPDDLLYCIRVGGGTGVCKYVTCDDHGTCMEYGDKPLCVCDPGYGSDYPESCEKIREHEDLCADPVYSECGEYGTCFNTTSKLACICADGDIAIFPDNRTCVEDTNHICDDVECSGHGACVQYGDLPLCICEAGYKRISATECIKASDNPCEEITCDEHGTCSIDESGKAVCICEDGYINNILNIYECIVDISHPCYGVTCGNHGSCSDDGSGNPICTCATYYINDPNNALICIFDEDNPCDAVTCGGHGTCFKNESGNAECECFEDYTNDPEKPLECISLNENDKNGNYMKDTLELAADQGTDCLDKTKRHSCSDFCDSFIGYKCSTKCTDDSQCISEDYFCRSDGRCAPKSFVSEWHVNEPNRYIFFPAMPIEDICDFYINWGDDSEEEHITDCSDQYVPHQYEKEGDVTITVKGQMFFSCDVDGYNYCNSNNYIYLTKIESFGPISIGSGAFLLADQLTEISTIDIPLITDSLYFAFAGAVKFDSPLDHWDTSNVTDMYGAFMYTIIFNHSINHWDTSNVEDMGGMFANTEAFNQPLNNWDTSSVISMEYMFFNAPSFNQPINDWDVSNVTSMISLFEGANSFDQPLDKWNTSNVIDMTGMFAFAYSFNQPINTWNTANVTITTDMFYEATSFNQSLESWTVDQISDDDSIDMFWGSGLSKENWVKMRNNNAGWAAKNIEHLGLPASYNE